MCNDESCHEINKFSTLFHCFLSWNPFQSWHEFNLQNKSRLVTSGAGGKDEALIYYIYVYQWCLGKADKCCRIRHLQDGCLRTKHCSTCRALVPKSSCLSQQQGNVWTVADCSRLGNPRGHGGGAPRTHLNGFIPGRTTIRGPVKETSVHENWKQNYIWI